MNFFKIEAGDNCQPGFTFIEMVITITILGILAAMAYSQLRTPNEKIACKEIYSNLQLAKMQAVSTGANVIVNVNTDLNSVEDVNVPNEVDYQTVAVAVPAGWPAFPVNGIDFDGAGGTQVTFTSKGMATNAGSVYLKDVDNVSRLCAVSVLSTGIVKMAVSSDGGTNWN